MGQGKELKWLYPELHEDKWLDISQKELDELSANQRTWVDWLERNPHAKICLRDITDSKHLLVHPIQKMGSVLPEGNTLITPAEGTIHFQSCIFDNSRFIFDNFEFTNKIDFSNVTFINSYLSFCEAKLMGSSDTRIGQAPHGVSLEFSNCNADDTTFDFSGSRIKNDFLLEGNGKYKKCEFNFEKIKLNGMAQFLTTFINSRLYLDDAVMSEFRFHSNVFDSMLSFAFAEFKENIFFKPDQYNGNNKLSFWGATFHKGSHFGQFQSCDPIDFRNSEFSRTPVFGNFQLDLRKESVKYGAFQRAIDIEDSSRFLRLKKLAKDADNHALALDCYANEMRSSYWHTLTGYKLAFYYLYDWTSNYGRSVSRPFMGLFMFWGLFCSAYWFSRTNLEASPWSSLVMSLGHSIPLYSGAKEARSAGMDDLYLAGIDIPHYVHALTIGQGIISGIFIFLIALALRNMFRS